MADKPPSEAPATLASALAAFQLEVPRIGKANTANTGTYSYKYADLADITAIVLPALAKHGLSFTSAPTLDDAGRFVLRYALRHVCGEAIEGVYPLPAANTAPQQIGSATSYARRYALCAVTGVAPGGDDDDATQAPPASRQPADRHESHWDADEQEMLRVGWEAEIDKAATPAEIADIGKKILAQKRGGEMSPATYQRLGARGGRRKAELEAEEVPGAGNRVAETLPA